MEETEVVHDSSEVICVEVEENEDGEIIYLEKIENDDYVVMDDDFCVVECEISTSGETSGMSENNGTGRTNECEPLEVIILPNFDENCDENPIILKQEIDETGNLSNENSDNNETVTPTVKNIRTYIKKQSNFAKIEHISEDKYMNFQTPVKKYTPAKTLPQTQKLTLLQLTSSKVSQISKPQMPILQEQKTEKDHISKAIVPGRRLNTFSQQRPKLWSHRVDRKNFDKSNLLNNITNITTEDGVSQEKQPSVKQGITNVPMLEVNSVELQTGVKTRVSDLPYQCEMCDKSFRQASSLVIHLKVHAGKYTDNCVLS